MISFFGGSKRQVIQSVGERGLRVLGLGLSSLRERGLFILFNYAVGSVRFRIGKAII